MDDLQRFQRISKIVKWLEGQVWQDDGTAMSFTVGRIHKEFPEYSLNETKAYLDEAVANNLVERSKRGGRYRFNQKDAFDFTMDTLIKEGLIQKQGDRYLLTDAGKDYAEKLIETNPTARAFFERLKGQ